MPLSHGKQPLCSHLSLYCLSTPHVSMWAGPVSTFPSLVRSARHGHCRLPAREDHRLHNTLLAPPGVHTREPDQHSAAPMLSLVQYTPTRAFPFSLISDPCFRLCEGGWKDSVRSAHAECKGATTGTEREHVSDRLTVCIVSVLRCQCDAHVTTIQGRGRTWPRTRNG